MRTMAILMVLFLAFPVYAMQKADMLKIISKIRKDAKQSNNVVIVAGVRGSDVSKQDIDSLKRELYWEE